MIVVGMGDKHCFQTLIDTSSLQSGIDCRLVWFDVAEKTLQQRRTAEEPIDEDRAVTVIEQNSADAKKRGSDFSSSHC